jgi:3-keto-5-aminohexanoate cleavage enzyme
MPDIGRSVVIAVAPNGARRDRTTHARLPVDIASIASESLECTRQGATMLHLHVRDERGAHSLDPGIYREAIAEVRRITQGRLLRQATTEAVSRYSASEQMHVARHVEADSVSLALRELLPGDGIDPEARSFFAWLRDSPMLPQYILYDAADATRLLGLLDEGIISRARASVLFVLGRYCTGQLASPRDLLEFLPYSGEFGAWFVCAFGQAEVRCAIAAAALGGHARVGFENNIQRPDGSPAESNAENVGRFAAILPEIGLRPADVHECRQILAGGGRTASSSGAAGASP